MATVDEYNNVFEHVQFHPKSYTGTATGATGVDTAGFESVTFIMTTGVVGATGSRRLALRDSDDDVTYAPVVNTEYIVNILGSTYASGVTGADDNKVYRVGYVGPKRYVKAAVVASAASNVAFLSVICQLGRPHVAPTPPNE